MSALLRRRALLGSALAGALAPRPGRAAMREDSPPLRIGTAGLLGVYYPIGSAICRLVRGGPVDTRLPSCRELVTPGSVYNLQALGRSEIELAVVQSDTLFQAVQGSGAFAADGPQRALRSVLSLVVEPFTVVSRGLFGPTSLADLQGRKVAVGEVGSGQQATVANLLQVMGWRAAGPNLVTDIGSDDQGVALCDGRVDAFVIVAASPLPTITEAAVACDARLIGLDEQVIQSMVEAYPYYRRSTIPGGTYPGNPEPIATFGTEALVVANAATPADAVHALVQSVVEGVAELRRLHLAFRTISPQSLVPRAPFLPVHDGAARYFRETGLA